MILLIGWLFCGVIAAAIGQKKGETVSSFIVGCIFGPLGILFALLDPGNRVSCPFCKEKINKAASICPHCRQELKMEAPQQLNAIDHPKVIKNNPSLIKKRFHIFWWGLIIVVGLIIWGAMSNHDAISSTSSTHNQTLDNTNYERQKPAETWTYGAEMDTITQKEIWTATVKSSNTISLGFPYSGPQTATLELRRHPQYGRDVIFVIERGQILCDSYKGCSVLVRFDNQPAERYAAVSAADNSTNDIFIRNYDKFVQKALKAKTAFIQVPIYQSGNPTLEFNVANLNLSK